MTLRTKTLTAGCALMLGAAAWAQDATTITVPLGDPSEPVIGMDGAGTVVQMIDGQTVVETRPSADPAPAAEVEPAAPPANPEPVELAETDAEAEAPVEVVAEGEADAAEIDVVPAEEPVAEEPAAEDAVEDVAVVAPTDHDSAEAAHDDEAAQDAEIAHGDEAADSDDHAAEADMHAEAEHAEAEHEEAEGDSHAAAHVTDVSFSFEGPFGKFDQFQLQRGLQVYTEVCSSCHGLEQVALRTLSDEGGPGLPEDQMRAYAEMYSIYDPELEDDRPRKPVDFFPSVSGMGMGPDLSLMAKARAGFHGPYGTGLSQLFNGIGGPEYIYSVLTGYNGHEKEQAGTILYGNDAFPGGFISMPPPLSEDIVTYEDGTPATVAQMSKDVSAFLMWTAEPHMMNRKKIGFVSVVFLIVLTSLLYLTNKRLWWKVKHGHEG